MSENRKRRILPFVIEFVKFASGFAAIVAAALITLHAASAAMELTCASPVVC